MPSDLPPPVAAMFDRLARERQKARQAGSRCAYPAPGLSANGAQRETPHLEQPAQEEPLGPGPPPAEDHHHGGDQALHDEAPPKHPASNRWGQVDAWIEPENIPPRQFLFGRHYVRKAIGATIAAGGRAKTTQAAYEAIAMACGFDPATRKVLPSGRLRVIVWNGEEDQDELDRRYSATCRHYKIGTEELGGRLFVKSVRDTPLRVVVLSKNGPTLHRPTLDFMRTEIERVKADVWMLDPWISFHSVNESDNAHMDLAIKEGLGAIASATNSAGEILHHPGKPKPGLAENVVEDARGASAILWAVRSARVMNFMTPEQATKLGISDDERRLHIRIANGKANLGPLGSAEWIKIEVEILPNGDQVACTKPWSPPDAFDGITPAMMLKCRNLMRGGDYRVSSQSDDWVGWAVAEQLGISISRQGENDPKDVARIKQILRMWYKTGVFAVEKRQDKNRQTREFVIPGPWTPEPETNGEFEL